jgi:ADP-heptose:LPS heptosyltransferase
MTPDFMRFVDKWMGVPLCLALSAVQRLLRPFARKISPDQIHKILIVQISERGAVILGYSAHRKLKELFPGAELYYVIFEDMKESITLLGSVPESSIFTIRSKSLAGLFSSTLRMLIALRRKNIDAVLDFELFSRVSALICCLSGAPIRVGFNKFYMEGLYRGSLHTHRVLYNHLRHISLNFLSLACALKESPGDVPLNKIKAGSEDIQIPRIVSTGEEKERMISKLRNICPGFDHRRTLVVINPNGSELLPLRRWPAENYIELARRLLAHPSVYLAITGSRSERKDASMICDAIGNSRCINLAGETAFRELIDLYNIAHLLVSNDSGPPNLASLTAIKTLVFFGPETPVCYKPLGDNVEALYADFLCSPCVSAYNHRKSACRDNKCLKTITVDEVMQRIEAILPQLHGTEI